MDESEGRTVSQCRVPPLNWFGGMLLALLLVGISDRALAQAPVVTGFSPPSGSSGTVITITGTGFGASVEENTVLLGGDIISGGVLLPVLSASPTQIRAIVSPRTMTNKIRVVVAGAWGESSDYFLVGPVITNLSPPRGSPGTTIQINGLNFAPSVPGNLVTINGIPATVTTASTNRLTAIVPPGASSGPVRISRNELSGSSAWPFEVPPSSLSIDGFSPGTGLVGSTVTLKGVYFGSNIASNHVTLNGIPATVASASFEAVTFVVPNGATTGPISLVANGQTFTTANAFHVAQSGNELVVEGPTRAIATAAPGQYIDLTFSAVAGENLGLGVSSVMQTPASSSKRPYVSVLKPDNTVLKTSICEVICALDLSAMSVSGTYTVRVFANNPTSTLSALVALTRTIEATITSAQPLALRMDRIGRISKIHFEGAAGDSRALELLRSSDSINRMDNRVEVRRADGTQLFSEGNAVKCTSYCTGSYLLLNLPDTGTYTLIIQQSDGWSENLRVQLIEPTPLEVDGHSFSGQANFAYQTGLMTFPGVVGQRLDVGIIVPLSANHLTSTYRANWVRASLFDPVGTLVAEVPACESLTSQFDPSFYSESGCAIAIASVPIEGEYTLAIRDIHPSFPTLEAIRFIATVSTPYVANAAIDGHEVSLNLNRPGQVGLVNFAGAAGQDLQFNGGPGYNSAAYFPLTARKPDGSVLLQFPVANVAGAVDLPTLPHTGTYTLEESAQLRKIQDRSLHVPITVKTMHSCSGRAGPISTTTSLGSILPAQVTLGETFSVSALVTPRNGICGDAQGAVTATVLGTSDSCTFVVPVQSNCVLTASRAGFQDLRLEFLPTDSSMFSTSSSDANDSLNVLKKPVAVTILGVSPEPTNSGQSFTTVVQVVPLPASTPAPTGWVYVRDDSGRSCSIYLPATSCSMTIVSAGIRTITATYNGDPVYASGVSSGTEHTVLPNPPTISSFSPTSGFPGSNVTINGTNFLSPFGSTSVRFNGTPASIVSATATRIVATVPGIATSGPIQVSVADQSVTSSASFTVKVPPAPTITSFTPASGAYGANVTINGKNYVASTSGNVVAFNGIVAAITSATTTRIVAKVPVWSTSGPISVAVGGRTGTSASNFIVTSPYPSPVISAFTPSSGVTGTPVAISGEGFSTVSADSNLVTFNGQPAFVTQYSATLLKVLVPTAAVTGPISVTVNGMTGLSATPFVVVPAGSEHASVSIAVEPEPSVAGQPFTIHIAVTPEFPTGPTPTGTVIVRGSEYGCIVTLPATACDSMQSEDGDIVLVATYTGDTTYAPAQSPDFPHITNPLTPTEICGFAPNTIPNDPAGFVSIDQLSGAVYSAGQARNIVGSGTMSVTFDSPPNGLSTPNGVIDVAGSFVGPVNTGITVNGVLAQTAKGRFLAPNVRLVPGINTLEAIATTLPGLTATASVTVTRSGTEPPVSFHAEQAIGMAPARIRFNLELDEPLNENNLQSIRIDTDGDGVFDQTSTTLDLLQQSFGYSKPGLFKTLLQVTSNSGQVHTATQWILIRSMAAERGALCDVYGYLKAKLLLVDPAASSLAFASTVRPAYLSGFSQIGAALPELAPELGTIASGFAGPNYAELLVMRDNPDETRSGFHVHMVQDADGVWRISGL